MVPLCPMEQIVYRLPIVRKFMVKEPLQKADLDEIDTVFFDVPDIEACIPIWTLSYDVGNVPEIKNATNNFRWTQSTFGDRGMIAMKNVVRLVIE